MLEEGGIPTVERVQRDRGGANLFSQTGLHPRARGRSPQRGRTGRLSGNTAQADAERLLLGNAVFELREVIGHDRAHGSLQFARQGAQQMEVLCRVTLPN